GVLTMAQTMCWRNSLTLWRATLAVTERNAVAHTKLAEAHLKRHQWDAALDESNQALPFAPASFRAHCIRGVALDNLNLREEALASFQRSCELAPTYLPAFCDRGEVLAKLNRPEEALACYQHACELDETYMPGHCGRALVLESMNRLDDALASLQRAC